MYIIQKITCSNALGSNIGMCCFKTTCDGFKQHSQTLKTILQRKEIAKGCLWKWRSFLFFNKELRKFLNVHLKTHSNNDFIFDIF